MICAGDRVVALGELVERDRLARLQPRAASSWSPISTPRLMLLRAWIGANEAAIAMRMPDHFSHCAAVSRELPTPLRRPGDDDLEVAVERARRARSRRSPSTIRPA